MLCNAMQKTVQKCDARVRGKERGSEEKKREERQSVENQQKTSEDYFHLLAQINRT